MSTTHAHADHPKKKPRVLSPKRAAARLIFASLAAMAAVGIGLSNDHPWWERMIVGWDAGAVTLVALAWWVIARSTPEETARRASSYDPGRHLVFGVASLASMFSMFVAAYVFKQIKTVPPDEQLVWTLLTLGSIALAWTMAHTGYALRYAHLYYRSDAGKKGLQFPGDEEPSDLDFAYFSFTIGMCFQVSDVVVCNRIARRAVLLHAVVSFIYNTMILALTMNLVLGMMT